MNILTEIENYLGEKIKNASSLGGGCIADSKVICTEKGNYYFLKSYSQNGNILKNEANGLLELAKARAIRIPKVIMQSDNFLLLEYIKTGRKKENFSDLFASQFAEMHKFTSDNYGFYENNFIGSNPQINSQVYGRWSEFYFNNRLLFQYKLAEKKGYINSDFNNAFKHLENILPNLVDPSEEKPSLLHGDLWGGNYMVDADSNPVLIDPAVYYGHREADLAMTMVFGGFDNQFYKTYNEVWPLPDGWEERINLYKLYHIMNHLNIFGTGYYSQALSLLRSYK